MESFLWTVLTRALRRPCRGSCFEADDNRLYLYTILAVSNFVFYFRYTIQSYTLVPVNTLTCNDLGSREMITTKISFLKSHLTQLLSQ